MDRPHRGPAGTALASHTPVTADLPVVTAAPGTAKLIEARNLEKLFGQTPALRGATVAAGPGAIVAGVGPPRAGPAAAAACPRGPPPPPPRPRRFPPRR